MSTQNLKRLTKGESLFREGEMSNAMYLIRSGMIRIFKKKGDSQIEIDTLRTGQIVGEMAFLDGNSRSASAEALIESELVEISQAIYQTTMNQAPEWLKVLIKAIVARLRATTTKLKNLEMASTEVDYSEGTTKRAFVYLSSHDCLKIASSVLLVASRSVETSDEGQLIRITQLERYGNQIMGIPLAKITSFIDILKQAGIVRIPEAGTEVFLKDAALLEQFIAYVADENLLEPTKRHDLSVRGFLVMSLIARNLSRYPKDGSQRSLVNVMEVKTLETPEAGKEPFRMDDFNELVKLGYATPLNVLSASEQTTQVDSEKFERVASIQRILKIIEAVNEQKLRVNQRQ